MLEGELFCRPEILRCFFGGRPLVLGGMVGFHRNFFGEGGYGLSYFFLVELESTYQDLFKNDFFEILAIFSGCAKILDHFFDKSSLLGNWLIPIERYP